MKRQTLTATLFALTAALEINLGTLNNGKWTAANCRIQPEAPELDSSSVDAYNDSLKEIRDWRQKAQTDAYPVRHRAHGITKPQLPPFHLNKRAHKLNCVI